MAAASLAVCACSMVDLGSASATLDLSECRNVDCGKQDTPTQDFTDLEAQSCSSAPAIPVEAIFYETFARDAPPCTDGARRLPGEPECAVRCVPDCACGEIGSCRLEPFHIAGAEDGTLWAVAGFSIPDEQSPLATEARAGGVWLRHYSARGALLASTVLAFERVPTDRRIHFSASVVADSASHAWVLVRRSRSAGGRSGREAQAEAGLDLTQLLELDGQGQRLGAPITLVPSADGSSIEFAAGQSLNLISRSPFGARSVAAIDPETRSVRFVHSRDGRPPIGNAAADPEGAVTLTTNTLDGMSNGQIEHYSADGHLLWERTWNPQAGDGPLIGVGVAGMRSGMVLVAGVLQIETWKSPRFLWLDPQGDVASVITLPEKFNEELVGFERGFFGNAPVEPAGTDAYVLIGDLNLPDVGRNVIAELGPAQNRCAKYAWSAEFEAMNMLAAGGSHLYFATETGIGRLAIPADEEDRP